MSASATLDIPFPSEKVKSADSQYAIPANPAVWLAYPSMKGLGDLPSTITRSELVKTCKKIDFSDDEQLRLLFVKTMMWGSGTRNGRGPRNTHKALDTPTTLSVLREAQELVAAGELAQAYQLHRRVPGVGPAFFTKWLWLMGASLERPKGTPQPLILDSRVWAALADLGWNSQKAADGSRNWGNRYEAYLLACAIWAKQHKKKPEDIEYSLFSWTD